MLVARLALLLLTTFLTVNNPTVGEHGRIGVHPTEETNFLVPCLDPQNKFAPDLIAHKYNYL